MSYNDGKPFYYDPKHPPSAHPVFGFPSHWTPADLDRSYSEPVLLLENASAPVTSAASSVGGKGVKLTFSFETVGASCDVTLYSVTSGGDVAVLSWTGVKASDVKFATNLEMVNLGGLPIKVAVSNISSGWVSIYASFIQ